MGKMLLFPTIPAQTSRFIHKPLECMENRCAVKPRSQHGSHKTAKELSKSAQRKARPGARLIDEAK
jgi:hypothetical protein